MGGIECRERLLKGKPSAGVLKNGQQFGSEEDEWWAALAEDSLLKGMFGARRRMRLFMVKVEESGEEG